MKKKFEDTPLFIIDNGRIKSTVNFSGCFDKITSSFCKTNRDSHTIFNAIVLSFILVEAIIKEKLREVSPALILNKIDPISIAIVSGKVDMLIESKKSNIDIRSASFFELLNRFLHFYDINKYKSGIISLKKIRNNIVHSISHQIIEEKEVIIVLSKYIFPFIKEYVSISNDLWSKVLKIQQLSYDGFKVELARKIFESEVESSKIKAEDVPKLRDKKDVLFFDQEFEVVSCKDLLCPACSNKSTLLITGVDFDSGPEGFSEYGFMRTECKVCSLELDEVEFREIVNYPTEYFMKPSDDDIDEWLDAIEPVSACGYEDYDWDDYKMLGTI